METGAQNLNNTVSGNPYTPGLYRYPNHVDSRYQAHKIRFDIIEVKSKSLDELQNNVNSIIEMGKTQAEVENANQGAASAEGQTPDAIQKLQTAATTLAVNAAAGTKKFLESLVGSLTDQNPAIVGGIANSGVLNAPTEKTNAVIELYTPDTLDFSSQFAYSSLNINDLIASVGSGILGSVPKVGKFMQGALASLNGGGLVKLGLNKAGYAINSQQQLMFQGVEFRSFGMAFVLTPTDEKEAQTIRDIVKTFRRYSSPEIVQNTAGFLFTPPAFFEISFHHNGSENDKIPKLLPCVCTGIEVNYAPNGWSAYKDGHPAQITIGLSFQETTILDRNKIDKGY
jgi:hypothetical protein